VLYPAVTDAQEFEMKFGQFEIIRWHPDVSIPQSINDVMEKIELADKLGMDEIWLGEHHFSRHGLVSGIFSMLGNIAKRVKNARIGSAVVVLPFHNPILVAEEAATIDILSNGRFTLGIGAGYQAQEFRALGVNIDEARQRFREYVDVIHMCWEDGPITYKGEFINVEDILVIPKPVQKPLPMTIAVSTSPESVDFAAKMGLEIMVGGPTAVMGQVPQVMELWHERMEHYGHPHEHIDLPAGMNIYVAPTMEEAESDLLGLEDEIDREFQRVGNPRDAGGKVAAGFKHWEGRDKDRITGAAMAKREGILPLVGTPEVVSERIEILRSKGVNSIRGTFGKAGLEQETALRCMRMFAEEVMPNFVDEPVPAAR
jgi:alkanesulfonate monooxygenase SsuD/methylene tetrahydromethanopterin reductase-like flavin-dependent oxidoreductase (luciferase family)